MSIVAISMKEVSGKINKPISGKVNIEHTPSIENVKKTKMVASFGDSRTTSPALDIEYSFRIRYHNEKDDFAVLLIKGNILYAVKDEKEADTLEKEWKKDKKLAGKEIDILNAIMRRNISKMLYLSEILNLPPVLQIPTFVKR